MLLYYTTAALDSAANGTTGILAVIFRVSLMQCDKKVTSWSYLVARESLWEVYRGDSYFGLQWLYCVTAGTNNWLLLKIVIEFCELDG